MILSLDILMIKQLLPDSIFPDLRMFSKSVSTLPKVTFFDSSLLLCNSKENFTMKFWKLIYPESELKISLLDYNKAVEPTA